MSFPLKSPHQNFTFLYRCQNVNIWKKYVCVYIDIAYQFNKIVYIVSSEHKQTCCNLTYASLNHRYRSGLPLNPIRFHSVMSWGWILYIVDSIKSTYGIDMYTSCSHTQDLTQSQFRWEKLCGNTSIKSVSRWPWFLMRGLNIRIRMAIHLILDWRISYSCIRRYLLPCGS